jgi:hypothetical protein
MRAETGIKQRYRPALEVARYSKIWLFTYIGTIGFGYCSQLIVYKLSEPVFHSKTTSL